MPYKNREDHNAACLRRYHANKKPHAATMKAYYRANIKKAMVSSAKFRANKAGIPFDITADDFEIPEYCPIFTTIKLEIADEKHNDGSPSLDRIVCSEGYVKGNIHVISNKANRYKNNSSLEELVALGEWASGILKLRAQ